MAGRTKKTSTKVAVVETAQKTEVLMKVKDMTPEKTGVNLAKAQAEVMKQFAEISARLAEQQQILATTEQAISIKQQELKELHGLSDVAMAQATLEDQITSTREAWNREKVEHERQWQEERDQLSKQSARTKADWEYDFDIHKKKKLQALTDELAASKRTHDTQIEAATKKLDERQQAVNAAEKEIAELRAQGATFDARVAKEVKSQVEAAAGAIKKQAEHDKQILQAEASKQVALAYAELTAARQEVAAMKTQLADAHETVQALRSDVKSISTEALRARAGKEALEAVQQMQQAVSGQAQTGKR